MTEEECDCPSCTLMREGWALAEEAACGRREVTTKMCRELSAAVPDDSTVPEAVEAIAALIVSMTDEPRVITMAVSIVCHRMISLTRPAEGEAVH